MESTSSPMSNTKQQIGVDGEVTQKLFTIQSSDKSGMLEQKPADLTAKDVIKSSQDIPEPSSETANNSQNDSYGAIDGLDTAHMSAVDYAVAEDTP
jgi:hypothetical protein